MSNQPTDPQAPRRGRRPAADASADPASALQRERDELYDRLLRKTAEFDNFRKRIERERRELTEWAAADVLARRAAGDGRLRPRARRGRAGGGPGLPRPASS